MNEGGLASESIWQRPARFVKAALGMVNTFSAAFSFYPSNPITHADLSSHIGPALSEVRPSSRELIFKFVLLVLPFVISGCSLFELQGGACGCNETSIIARLAEQVKQGAPGVDGKPGMPGLPVSSFVFVFFFFID